MHFTQPVDIKSWWSHNWKSAQVVNSDLVCDPQSGNRVSISLGNSGLNWTIFARNRDSAAPAEGNGDLQTLICVLVARPRRYPTWSNPVPTKLDGGFSQLHSVDEDCFMADQLWLMTCVREEEEDTQSRRHIDCVMTLLVDDAHQ